MIRTEFFCDIGNPSMQRRDEGDEQPGCYAVVVAETATRTLPEGWGIVHDEGRGKPGIACAHHRAQLREKQADPLERSERGHRRLDAVMPPPAARWPSHTSPFDQTAV